MGKARLDDEESVEEAIGGSCGNTEPELDNMEDNNVNVEDDNVKVGDNDVAVEANAVNDDYDPSPRQVHNKTHASSHPKPSSTR